MSAITSVIFHGFIIDGGAAALLCLSKHARLCRESRSMVVHGTAVEGRDRYGLYSSGGGEGGGRVCAGVGVCVCARAWSRAPGRGEELKAPSNTWGSCESTPSPAVRRACSHRVYLTRSQNPPSSHTFSVEPRWTQNPTRISGWQQCAVPNFYSAGNNTRGDTCFLFISSRIIFGVPPPLPSFCDWSKAFKVIFVGIRF